MPYRGINYTKSAVLSEDKAHRYLLRRQWAQGGRTTLFVMLNPSTADAEQDDQTIRRCASFAASFGCFGMEVVNLYSYRATLPDELRAQKYPTGGSENDRHLREAVARAHIVICAWGANAQPARAAEVLDLIASTGKIPMCLGVTNSGAPKHPLYLSLTKTKLVSVNEARTKMQAEKARPR